MSARARARFRVCGLATQRTIVKLPYGTTPRIQGRPGGQRWSLSRAPAAAQLLLYEAKQRFRQPIGLAGAEEHAAVLRNLLGFELRSPLLGTSPSAWPQTAEVRQGVRLEAATRRVCAICGAPAQCVPSYRDALHDRADSTRLRRPSLWAAFRPIFLALPLPHRQVPPRRLRTLPAAHGLQVCEAERKAAAEDVRKLC